MAATLLQRFQGSIVGGVIGDCVGAVYEEMWGSFIGLEKVLGLIRKLQTGIKYSSTILRKILEIIVPG